MIRMNTIRAAMKYVKVICKKENLITNYKNVKEHYIIYKVLIHLGYADVPLGRKLTKDYLINLYHSSECEYIKRQNGSFYNTKEWKALKKVIHNKYGHVCMKCGFESKSNCIDHIKPRSTYPKLELEYDNMQVLCKICNLIKSNRVIIDYRNV